MNSKHTRSRISWQKVLLLMCGLPGSGKTTTVRKLMSCFKNYTLIDQNELRRKRGIKKMPKHQDAITVEINKLVARLLKNGRGVIFDSVNRMKYRRHQLYGIASSLGKQVVVLEVVCREETAKKRIGSRPKSDGLLSDPNNTAVYDRLKKEWEDVKDDYTNADLNWTSYVQFDTDHNELKQIVVQKGMSSFVTRLGHILSTPHQ